MTCKILGQNKLQFDFTDRKSFGSPPERLSTAIRPQDDRERMANKSRILDRNDIYETASKVNSYSTENIYSAKIVKPAIHRPRKKKRIA